MTREKAVVPVPASPVRFYETAPGPIAALVDGPEMADLVHQLRDAASGHSDTAWLHPAPSGEKGALANTSQDLCDAIGAVGLRPPRSAGERHLLRPLVHLLHGPVRHVLVDDANNVDLETLDALHEAALISQTQLWLLIDAADRTARSPMGDLRQPQWVDVVCTLRSPSQLLDEWARRPTPSGCPSPTARWWHTELPAGSSWTNHCSTPGAHPTPQQQVDCLLAHLRRALTAGHLTATQARHRLLEYRDLRDSTAEHWWALTAASRDHWTPGMDALGQTHPAAQKARLGDIAPGGDRVRIDGNWVSVHPMRRAAVARLRTSRRLAGCLAHEPVDGIFDKTPGAWTARR